MTARTPAAYGRATPNARLNGLMAERGFTNTTLADAAGVSTTTISSMRNRRRIHCPAVRVAVAAALGCPPEELGLNGGHKEVSHA